MCDTSGVQNDKILSQGRTDTHKHAQITSPRPATAMAPDCSTAGSNGYRRPCHTPPSRLILGLHQSTSHTNSSSTSARTSKRIKERLTNRDSGSPYPNPAIGALNSLAWKSTLTSWPSIVVYMYVHTSGMALRLMPPPSSEILIVMSSVPSTTISLIGGREDGSVSGPKRSTTARREFLSSSKRMCDLREEEGVC